MCKLVIVGHGNFPSGVLSAVSLLVEVHIQMLKDSQKIKELLDNNDKVIVVADLTGGAPHQIAARLILESGKMNQYIISGINLALVVDLAMKCCFSEVEEEELETMLLDSVNDSKETMTLLSNRM